MNIRSKLKKLEEKTSSPKPRVLFVSVVGRKDYNWVCDGSEFFRLSGESDQQFQDRIEKIILKEAGNASARISICRQGPLHR